jgi:hypothetical protein
MYFREVSPRYDFYPAFAKFPELVLDSTFLERISHILAVPGVVILVPFIAINQILKQALALSCLDSLVSANNNGTVLTYLYE